MRLIWLVFLFCLAGVGASLTVPTVTIQGIVFGAQGPRAIVAGPNTTFLVQTGDLLGDYRVESIELEAVTFGFRELRFRMAVEPRAGRSRTVTPSNLRPRGPDDSIDLRLHGAELAYALKLLARVNEQPICCGPSVAGQVDMEVQEGSLDGTMEALAASGG
ncbi:hypothetical protein IV102_30875, partial [bacterium]|nr:hypothetical protein [bacterium]